MVKKNEQLRDPEELEGALLAAVAVPDDGDSTPTTGLPLAHATVATDEMNETFDVASGGGIEEAVPFPAYHTSNDDERERREARAGTAKGRMAAKEEIVDIHRHNRIIDAINYNENQKVELANQRAAISNLKEETGLTQTSYTMPFEKYLPGPERKAPEFYEGTYGKGGYEVSEYDTKEYSTRDYDITEYKSVYDKR